MLAITYIMESVPFDDSEVHRHVNRALGSKRAHEYYVFAFKPGSRLGDCPDGMVRMYRASFEVPEIVKGLPEDEAYVARFAISEYRLRRAVKHAMA